jgi:hypothetical protein
LLLLGDDASDASTSSSQSKVLLQYQHLLTDLSASSLEASSTLMDLAGFNQMDNTVSLDRFTCRVMIMMNFFSHVTLSNIAILGDAWSTVSLRGSMEEPAINVVSLLLQELLENSTSPVLDCYANAILTSCAEDDESFLQLQDTAEVLTLHLMEKKKAILLYSANQILPFSISAEATNPVIDRILDILGVIITFPFFWFVYLPFSYFAVQSWRNPRKNTQYCRWHGFVENESFPFFYRRYRMSDANIFLPK